MMKLKVFSILVFFSGILCAQEFSITGKVTAAGGEALVDVEIWNKTDGTIKTSNANGEFRFEGLAPGIYNLVAFTYDYQIIEKEVQVTDTDKNVIFELLPLQENLNEVVINARREQLFALRKLRKVEGTSIYAGKKSEVVILDKTVGNIAANNARQIYNQVVGLNIYDNGDAGLQLNIGGRGLDPNRSQNFNTRQNGYDISADVLGYPESYYTPPPEALQEIQIVRGAASLQYGTQFGGLVNFVFKKPSRKKIELVSRQSVGSNSLFTSFNSISGTLGDFSYYTYYHYKGGNGFRPNSEFNSHNAFAHLGWNASEKTKISFEYTFLDYLAQQPGGLTDAQFYEDPEFSNRERNWFDVNWNLFALKLEHAFSEKTDFSFNIFGLNASRKAVGYRDNRVSSVDNPEAPRELLIDDFSNWGAEARLLSKYDLFENESVFLIGSKYYDANNQQKQGPGSAASDADFNFYENEFPDYQRQSEFDFPNKNLAIFGENIFNITSELSITPGFRFEYIDTKASGQYQEVLLDLAGNPIINRTLEDDQRFERAFVLLGIGAAYDWSPSNEIYANFSQNYRSVTFNDIRVINPVFEVDPFITDEEGFTADIGLRGRLKNKLSYDVSVFGLKYNDRIGEVFRNDAGFYRLRTNIGDAFIYGLETFAEWNIKNTFFEGLENYRLTTFINSAFTKSEYTRAGDGVVNVEGNEVEFIPAVNLKTGINFGYKNFLAGIQYTYLSRQFTDASNAPQRRDDTQRGIEGAIPAYGIMDLSASYSFGKFRVESGINNLLNKNYFTRRATGYPGPGIIPAQPLNWYTTLQVKL